MTRSIHRAGRAGHCLAAAAASLASLVLVTACGDTTTTPLTVLNLNRPVDIAFGCYGKMRVTGGAPAMGTMGQPLVFTAEPSVVCDSRAPQEPARLADGSTVPLPPPLGQEDLPNQEPLGVPTYYGFILQSASGTVALSSFPVKPSDSFAGANEDGMAVLDADQLTPGKNAISIGEDPVGIATDTSGCYELTPNAGSCDISVLDITSAVNAAVPTGTPQPIQIERLPVTNQAGQVINAKPAAIAIEPNTTVVGNTCPLNQAGAMAPTGLAYIAYPGCHLVAAVDLSDGISGKIVGGIQFDATGAATVLAPGSAALDNLTCPDECNGMPATPGVRPVALDLRFQPADPIGAITGSANLLTADRARLAIGAQNSSKLTIVDIDVSSPSAIPLPIASSLEQIQLQDPTGTLGISQLSVSPQIGMGGSNQEINDTKADQFQFIYAVASDSSVRVAEVLRDNFECDTQVDTRFVRPINITDTVSCFKVGDPATPPRRSGARGPGIQLTETGVPTSVVTFKGLDHLEPGGTFLQSTLIGYFAVITASSGRSYIVNIDDDAALDFFTTAFPLSSSPALTMAHQLRDTFTDRDAPPPVTQPCTAVDPDASALSGGPRSTTLPGRTLPTATISTDVTFEMPGLQQLTCTGVDAPSGTLVAETQLGAPEPVRDETFPDLRNALTEGWSLTWEGPLSANASTTSTTLIDGPQVRSGQMVVDSAGMRMVDGTQPYCEMGVEPFDILQFRGCNPANDNSDCPAGYTCFIHPDSKVAGIGTCMLATEATRLAASCRDFGLTMRRYTVATTTSGAVTLLPRKHELYATPINGCTDDNECDLLARYEAGQSVPSLDPVTTATLPLRATDTIDFAGDIYTPGWQCQADPLRAPVNSDPNLNKRCVLTCAFHSADKTDPNYDGKDRDTDCSAATTGTVCVGATPAARGTCMEGIAPPQSCVNGPQSYDVRAGEAFTVIGATSGFVHPLINQNGACVRDPAASRLQIGRIPLKAPACADPAMLDPITGIAGQLIDGTFEPNPCSMQITQSELQRNYQAGPGCNSDQQNPDTLTTRQATAIKFSNRAFTIHLTDPTYPGDLACAQDRKGPFQDVSFIIPGAGPTSIGYQIEFDQKAGFTPMTVPGISPVYPVKVVRGPGESLWVMDDGDLLSSLLGLPSTQGQVYRVESANINVSNLLQ